MAYEPDAFVNWNCVLEGALDDATSAVAVMFSGVVPAIEDHRGNAIVPETVAV